MDEFLAKAGSQAVSFAIRSGISIASGYAIKTVSSFLDKIPADEKVGIERTKKRLQTKIDIISSAIDLIKLVAARGNSNLESTLRLTKDLKQEIDSFDETVASISCGVDGSTNQSCRKNAVKDVEVYMKDLLERIEEAIPLISLSLTTSGANLSGALPSQVSPGRLLQASTLVTDSNRLFDGSKRIQVGPSFDLVYYTIFYNLKRKLSGNSEITWKEDFARSEAKIWRNVSKNHIYSYTLEITENFNDGRYHDPEEESPRVLKYDVSSITRLFFSGSGKLLKLEEKNSPVLVLKINKEFSEDYSSDESSSTDESKAKIEWIAFGENEDDDSDSSSDSEDEEEGVLYSSRLILPTQSRNEVKSLSLMEYILRLCTLQSNDQISILEINDERLSLYLNDENKVQSEKVSESTKTSPNSKKNKSFRMNKKLTEKLQALNIDVEEKIDNKPEENKVLQTPVKSSPVPGDKVSSEILTPWERDRKQSRSNHRGYLVE